MAFLDEVGLAELWSLIGEAYFDRESASKLARIEAVTYSGTGVGGKSNPSSVQFSFTPDFIILMNAETGEYNMVMCGGTAEPLSDNDQAISQYLHFTWGGGNVSWYAKTAGSATSSALSIGQYNVSGDNYKVIACKAEG